MYQLLHRLGKYPIEESECVGSAIERRDRMQMNRRSIVSLVLSTGATGIAAPTFAFSQAPPASDTPAGTLKVTIPNHVAVDIVATPDDVWRAIREERSEEHTSELQSLLRSSDAVFSWHKQNTPTN